MSNQSRNSATVPIWTAKKPAPRRTRLTAGPTHCQYLRAQQREDEPGPRRARSRPSRRSRARRRPRPSPQPMSSTRPGVSPATSATSAPLGWPLHTCCWSAYRLSTPPAPRGLRRIRRQAKGRRTQTILPRCHRSPPHRRPSRPGLATPVAGPAKTASRGEEQPGVVALDVTGIGGQHRRRRMPLSTGQQRVVDHVLPALTELGHNDLGTAISGLCRTFRERVVDPSSADDLPGLYLLVTTLGRTRSAVSAEVYTSSRRRADQPISWVGPGRGVGIAPGPFPRPTRRTRRACFHASGAPRVLPAGQPLVAVTGFGVHGVGIVLPRYR
jgi:hypothetical protein